MISFISIDGKKYHLMEDTIDKFPECYIKGLATRFIKKDMDITLIDDCIYLEDTSLYLDDVFNGLIYNKIEHKSNEHSANLNEILDRYCIELRAPIIKEPIKKNFYISHDTIDETTKALFILHRDLVSGRQGSYSQFCVSQIAKFLREIIKN